MRSDSEQRALADIRSPLLLHPIHGLLQNCLSDLLQQLWAHLHTWSSTVTMSKEGGRGRRWPGWGWVGCVPEGLGSMPPCRQCLDHDLRPSVACGPALVASGRRRNHHWSKDTVVRGGERWTPCHPAAKYQLLRRFDILLTETSSPSRSSSTTTVSPADPKALSCNEQMRTTK